MRDALDHIPTPTVSGSVCHAVVYWYSIDTTSIAIDRFYTVFLYSIRKNAVTLQLHFSGLPAVTTQ